MKYFIVLLICMLSVFHMHAQSLSLFDVDASNFPTMKAKFYAFDAGGKQVRPNATELSLTENGINRPITSVLCQQPIPTKAVSVAISIDVSGSMGNSYFTDLPIDLSKLTATTLCRQIVMPPSEFALQICDTKPYIIQYFTANKNKTLQAINQITAAGGNDFVEQMLNKLAGLLNIAKNGTHKKVAVLCTDAGGLFFKTDELQACIDTCKKYNIEFYAVVFQGKGAEPKGIQQSLQQIAIQTGGYVFDNVTSKAVAEQIASEIQQKSQGATPCEITWASDITCQVGNAITELAWMDVKSQSTYSPPANATASLIANPAFAAFGKCLPSTQHDTTIKLTAQNADYKVTGIRRNFGSAAFSIVNTTFPFIVPKNSERTITIRFAPSDSAMQYASFQIETDKCSSYFSAGGGFPTKKTTNPTLKLTKPNGGETYVVGSDSLITWDGISPSDSVVLEYSIDNGISWKILQTKASNLEYIWKNIPKPSSSQCKVRIKQKSNVSPSDSSIGQLLFNLTGHTSPVTTVSWSPDGVRVATASNDSTIRIWDANNGSTIQILKGHTGGVNALSWSPDGTKIATGSSDATLVIWDVITAVKFRTIARNLFNKNYLVMWSPDGLKIAIGGSDSIIYIWDVSTPAPPTMLLGHSNSLSAIKWNSNGSKIASSSWDSTATIWDASTGVLLFTLKGHKSGVYDLSWSPDRSKIATTGGDSTVRIWDVSTGKTIHVLNGHTHAWIYKANWSPDGSKVASASYDSTAIIWDVSTGKILHTLHGHANFLQDVIWSPDGSKLATSSIDKTIKIWDAESGNVISTLIGHASYIRKIDWNPDGLKIASASEDNTAKIWKVDDFSLQEDISDATFSIVAPMTASQNVDMRQCLVGAGRDSVVSTFVQNTGTFPFRVDSIIISGADASQFSLVSGIPPFSVASGSARPVEFHFAPTSIGVKTAQIVIYTQADTLIQTIQGEGITPMLSVIGDIIDFGRVEVGKRKDTMQVVTIKNTGTVPLNITATRHAGPNDVDFTTVSGGGNFVVNQGDTALFDLRFAPKSIGRTSGRLLFEYNGFGSPASVQLYGEGTFNTTDTARTTVIAQDITAQAGEKVNLTLKLQKPTKMEVVEAPTEWYARIHYNKSILYNVQTDNQCLGTTDSCMLELSGVYDPKTDELISIPCITTLGNTDHSMIVIDTFLWMNSAILTEVATQNGSITLNGVCEDGGVRLFIPAKNSTSLSTRPNPAQDNLQIHYGLREPLTVTLELLTMTGQVVQTILNNQAQVAGQYTLTSDLRLFGNGVYLLRMRTNKEMLTTRVDVVK